MVCHTLRKGRWYPVQSQNVSRSYDFDPELGAGLNETVRLPLEDIPSARWLLNEYSSSRPGSGKGFAPATNTISLPRPDGTVVRVKRFSPRGRRRPVPAVLFLHGGGFVFGTTAFDERFSVALVQDVGCDVFLVDYRLAPEYRFPAALNDCFEAFNWVMRNSHPLGVDAERIALVGKSAGACLAVGVSLRVRDEGREPACIQILNQPVLDDRLRTRSMIAFTDTPVWNRRSAELTWAYYLGWDREHDGRYAVPARVEQLHSLPPTCIGVAEFDPLRDEATEFARRLRRHGVSVQVRLYPGTFHGSDASFSDAAISRRQHTDLHDWLRAAFTPRLRPYESSAKSIVPSARGRG